MERSPLISIIFHSRVVCKYLHVFIKNGHQYIQNVNHVTASWMAYKYQDLQCIRENGEDWQQEIPSLKTDFFIYIYIYIFCQKIRKTRGILFTQGVNSLNLRWSLLRYDVDLFSFIIPALLSVLGMLDAYFIHHAYYSTLIKGASVQLVFGFEVSLVIVLADITNEILVLCFVKES